MPRIRTKPVVVGDYSWGNLGCDIGGAKELGVIYFPTNWGAKEPQNLPNHRVELYLYVLLFSQQQSLYVDYIDGTCSMQRSVSLVCIDDWQTTITINNGVAVYQLLGCLWYLVNGLIHPFEVGCKSPK